MSEITSQSRPVPGLALCLASSFFGHYAHVGLLNRLHRAGVMPERIAGSSAGAIAGGLFAAGIRGHELEDLVMNFWFKRAFGDAGFLVRWPFVMCGIHGTGFLSGERMKRFLRKRLGERRLEDLREPILEVAVSNLTKQRPELVQEGSLVDFMVASFSIPCLFKTQRIEGCHYVDGGVVIEAPFGHLLDDPSVDTVAVHTIRHPQAGHGAPRTLAAVLVAMHRLVACHMIADLKEKAARCDKRVIFVETEHRAPRVFEFAAARDYIRAGEATGGRLLEELEAGVHA
jgi:NTE family protein